MTLEFPEPKTEEEAQRIKRFLEAGGDASVKDVQTFAADGTGRVTLAQPVTLKFGATGEQVLRVATGADRRATIALELSEVKSSDEFFAAVFLNKPDASARTGLDDPAFVGTVSFFVHSADHPGPSDKDNADPLKYELDITETLKRIQRPGDAITLSVVLLPQGKAPSATAGIAIRRLTLRVVESVVKRRS